MITLGPRKQTTNFCQVGRKQIDGISKISTIRMPLQQIHSINNIIRLTMDNVYVPFFGWDRNKKLIWNIINIATDSNNLFRGQIWRKLTWFRIKINAANLESWCCFAVPNRKKSEPAINQIFNINLHNTINMRLWRGFGNRHLPECIWHLPDWLYFKCFTLETIIKHLWSLFVQNIPAGTAIIASFHNPVRYHIDCPNHSSHSM